MRFVKALIICLAVIITESFTLTNEQTCIHLYSQKFTKNCNKLLIDGEEMLFEQFLAQHWSNKPIPGNFKVYCDYKENFTQVYYLKGKNESAKLFGYWEDRDGEHSLTTVFCFDKGLSQLRLLSKEYFKMDPIITEDGVKSEKIRYDSSYVAKQIVNGSILPYEMDKDQLIETFESNQESYWKKL
jgi:hypothetical protein